jgi:K+-transporting ATPase c subunit
MPARRSSVLDSSASSFSDPKYFWGRPSATAPQPYNGLASGGSNLGPLNPALLDAVKANVKRAERGRARERETDTRGPRDRLCQRSGP